MLSLNHLAAGAYEQTDPVPSSDARRSRPTPQDWERHRNTIKRLYLDEDKTLNDVMSIMAQEYQHNGTKKMYKSRITKWQYDKNNRELDMAVILRKKTQRDAVDKASSFRVRDRTVEIEEVIRYCRRKGLIPQLQPALPDAATPPYISCLTPSPVPSPCTIGPDLRPDTMSPIDQEFWDLALAVFITQNNITKAVTPEGPDAHYRSDEQISYCYLDKGTRYRSASSSPSIPPFMSPPPVLLIPEQLFSSIKSYFNGSFGNKAWITDDEGELMSVSFGNRKYNVVSDFHHLAGAASALLKQGSFVEGRMLLSRACALVQHMLKAESPNTLEIFLETFLYLRNDGFVEIAASIQRYISEMAMKILSKYHPWCQICKLLGLLNTGNPVSVLQQSWQCVIDAFEHELGPYHKSSLMSRLVFLDVKDRVGDNLDRERVLGKLLSDCESLYGPFSSQALSLVLNLGYMLYHQYRNAEAEALCKELLERSQIAKDKSFETSALHLSALVQYDLHQEDLAERHMREVLKKEMGMHWRERSQCISNMVTLQGWLREWGREEEAAQLQAEIEELIGPDEFAC